MDLTQSWKSISFESEPFTDTWYETRCKDGKTDELLIFTDGSVQDRAGGYGYHIIPGSIYNSLSSLEQPEYDVMCQQNLRQEKLRFDHFRALSSRCSIDFCEVHAIHSALTRLYDWISGATAAHRYSWTRNDILQNRHGIRSVRIVSDSLTVLKWLNGEYIVRDKTMKLFLDEIYWLIAMFDEQLAEWDGVCFQWVHSHVGTRGNEFVDDLAKRGMEDVDPNYRYPVWKYYSKKAVNTEIKQYWRTEMSRLYLEWRIGSFHGSLYRDHDIRRIQGFKKEIARFNRDELRILLSLRTGHCKLPYFMFMEFPGSVTDNQCQYCTEPGTLSHYFLECEWQQQSRMMLIDYLKQQYQMFYDNCTNEKILKCWHPNQMNYYDLGTYVFPPMFLSTDIRMNILAQTILF